MTDAITIRRLCENDSMAELTALLHRAYAPLAQMGLRFVATHQNEQVTAERCASGETYVGEVDGRVVATLTLREPGKSTGCEWYSRPDVAVFGQFAVEPCLQGRGVGGRMLELAERRAFELGARELALDTSEDAIHLIEYYARRGYRHVGFAQWPVVNYRSVIMSKGLKPRRALAG